MVHLYRKPYIHGVMPLALIYVYVDGERIGAIAVILYQIGAGLTHIAEIALGVVVSVIEHTPLRYLGLAYQLGAAVGVDAVYLGLVSHAVIAVKLYHCHLFLGGSVTNL